MSTSLNTRNETTYHEVVGVREGNEVVILDYTFIHGDGFHGATGTTVYPVSQAEIDEALTEDSIQEYYEEIWREDAKTRNGTTLGLAEWVEETVDDDEYLDSRFEEPSGLDTDDINEALGLTGDDKPVRYAVSSCGRIFTRALSGITAAGARGAELIGIIDLAEEGNV